jgi:hypothetical protein
MGVYHHAQFFSIEMGVMWTFLLWLAWNVIPPNLSLPSSWDYRCEALAPCLKLPFYIQFKAILFHSLWLLCVFPFLLPIPLKLGVEREDSGKKAVISLTHWRFCVVSRHCLLQGQLYGCSKWSSLHRSPCEEVPQLISSLLLFSSTSLRKFLHLIVIGGVLQSGASARGLKVSYFLGALWPMGNPMSCLVRRSKKLLLNKRNGL